MFENFFKKKEYKADPPNLNEVAYADSYSYMYGGKNPTIRYNPSVLMSNKGVSVIDSMKKDDQIKIALSFKKSSILATGWEICAASDNSADRAIAEFVEENIYKIKGTFERKLLSIMTALEYGFSITEMIWENDNKNILLKNIKTRKPHDIEFLSDAYGNLTNIMQNSRELPIEKFVIYSYDSEFENMYGTSDLEAAYRPWWLKDNSYRWMSMLLERLGIPPIFALYDSNYYQGNSLTKLRSIIQNLQAATVASIPTSRDSNGKSTLDFWSPELADNIGNVFIPALNMMNSDIARAILMPQLLGATPDSQTGSYARSQTHFDIYMFVIQRIRNEIQENVVNEQIIKPLIDVNFNVKNYPIFKFLPFSDDLRVDIFDTWAGLVDGKIVEPQPSDEEHIRSVLGFPEKDESAAKANGPKETNNEDTNEEITDEEYSCSHKENLKTYREKNQYEKKIDFAAIQTKLEAREKQITADLKKAIKDEQDYLILKLNNKKLQYNRESKYIRTSLKSKLSKILKDGLINSAKDGKDDLMQVKNFKSDVGYITSIAERWLGDRANLIGATLSEKINTEISFIMSNAVRSGQLVGVTISQIQDVLLPYVGNENVLVDDNSIEAYRIETLVRTNTTAAFNQGRLVAIRDPDIASFVQGVEYSAIIDSRTTAICSKLDGKIFKPDDPDLDRLIPPNHYGCRSVLIPIMIDEIINSENQITAKEKGEALDLAGVSFG